MAECFSFSGTQRVNRLAELAYRLEICCLNVDPLVRGFLRLCATAVEAITPELRPARERSTEEPVAESESQDALTMSLEYCWEVISPLEPSILPSEPSV